MHFEILVEDVSGKEMLEILMPKIIDQPHTFRIKAYKGIGTIPKGMKNPKDASKRILLENLPKILQGYGRTFNSNPNYQAVVILVCDLDDKCLKTFRAQLDSILLACVPKPDAVFCLAIEEGEAWLLGDLVAIKAAYPKAKESVLQTYTNDSICGTWEILADAIYTGGSGSLKKAGWQSVGREKSEWAKNIVPFMTIDRNLSPSFHYFVRKIRRLAT